MLGCVEILHDLIVASKQLDTLLCSETLFSNMVSKNPAFKMQ